MVDYRDLVIVDIAAENAELFERMALTQAYRETVQLALEQLAERTRELESARRRIAGLVDEVRALRITVA
jgi:hypothetical protein